MIKRLILGIMYIIGCPKDERGTEFSNLNKIDSVIKEEEEDSTFCGFGGGNEP